MRLQKKHNFGAGPCILPEPVMRRASRAVIDWDGTGLSILEVSHRSPEFEQVIKKTKSLICELLKVPKEYEVLFLQGGASSQFSMVPMNFLQHSGKKAAYLDTGYFSIKAIKQASLFGELEVVDREVDLVKLKKGKYAYVHVTSNDTIEGTQRVSFPKLGIPLVCDMSSDIFSREINVADFSLIYAGAQKNMGPAGLTVVIVRSDMLDQIGHQLPAMWDYRVYKQYDSLYNTPPVFSIYVTMLNLLWLKEQGGVGAIQLRNNLKSALLYNELDNNRLFKAMAPKEKRSRMNVTFWMYDLSLEPQFLNYATQRGVVGIKGFSTTGGFRVSLYNALPLHSVELLVKVMQDFEALQHRVDVNEIEQVG